MKQQELPGLEFATKDSIICTFFNGESEKIEFISENPDDAYYFVKAYFPNTDLEINFTTDGVPSYDTVAGNEQTAFLKEDLEKLNFTDFDFTLLEKEDVLTEAQIKSLLKNKNKNLKVRTDLGNWFTAINAPSSYIDDMIINKNFHCFKIDDVE